MDGTELKGWERLKDEVQGLRGENRHLRLELDAYRPRAYQDGERIGELKRRIEKLERENAKLRQRVSDLTAKLQDKPPAPAPPPGIPPFVKANVPDRRRKKPGRKVGHVAALRPMPAHIDVHQEVALPVDLQGKPSCPHCRTQLSEVRQHERVVEDLVPSKVVTTCYHTQSGWCPGCRKHVESRAADQPPAADLPHAQLGLSALATVSVLRVCYRLPLRQIAKLLAQLPGLKISPGGIARQINRQGKWLANQHHRLKLALRVAGVVHGDETGWRINGKNGYLWTLTNDRHTLYHVDRSRGGDVIVDLLGESFGQQEDQTLVSDFYSVYDRFDGPPERPRKSSQKCLAHLLRELRDTIAKRPELADHDFFKQCKSLTKALLRCKKQRDLIGADAYAARVVRLEARLKRLSETTWGDADADRLAARLKKHRPSLTTFLHRPEVDGTNNAAERALRPAVVMRKITGGSRGEQGAQAWAILASVMRTAEQQGRDVVETVKTLLRAQWDGKDIAILTDTS